MNKQQIEKRVIFLSRTIRDQERAAKRLEKDQQGYFWMKTHIKMIRR